jgi:three-Cys-motif partner protein
MTADDFFSKQSPESAAKTEIVANFFAAWLNIIGNTTYRGRLAYMELYAGAGKFADGSTSTPLRVLQTILTSPHAARFRVVLNEMDDDAADLLRANAESLPNVGVLGNELILTRVEITRDNALSFLKYIDDFPAVLFVDPFGYKGVSARLFGEYMRNGWGRDAILFFNHKRINAALSNPAFTEHMEALFGRARVAALRKDLPRLHAHEREERVHAEMEASLREAGVAFIHRFDFEKRHDSIFFMSMKEKGLRTMKDVMRKRSTGTDDGVASFSFGRPAPVQTSLFAPRQSATEILIDDLLVRFAGRTLTFEEIVANHHPGTNYVPKNYRDALLQLEAQGTIKTDPARRRSGTFGPNVRVTFPRREE